LPSYEREGAIILPLLFAIALRASKRDNFAIAKLDEQSPKGEQKRKVQYYMINEEFELIQKAALKGLCPIRVMSNFDFFNPGR
jgi:hypothetical protein